MEEIIEVGERVVVAVPENIKDGKSLLAWAFQSNVAKDAKVVIAHVHIPLRMIPTMGAVFEASRANTRVVRYHRQIRKTEMQNNLQKYLDVCKKLKTEAELAVIENDDIVEGIKELIVKYGITKLVMGAAKDKHYKNLRELKSKKAIRVKQDAHPSCKIWFVCKGKLIQTREAAEVDYQVAAGPRGSAYWEDILRGINWNCEPERPPTSDDDHVISPTASSRHDDVISRTAASLLPYDEQSDAASVLPTPEHEFLPSHDLGLGVDADIYNKFNELLAEVKKLKNEALEESRERQKASREWLSAKMKVKSLENLHSQEMKRRKEVEETLEKEKQEIEQLKSQRDELTEELHKAYEEKVELEDNLVENRCRLRSLQAENELLRLEQDNAVKEAQELRNRREQSSFVSYEALGSEFSVAELKQATQNFSDSLKLGHGGYGAVYKGFLRNTTVAIKRLHPGSLRGQSEFHQEVSILSRVRHPNLVALIGSCKEASALVYEFLPNGSLEDRLVRKNNTTPLSWQARIRILGEICSALIFLNMNKPHPIVHGDLKPENILLDANFVSKLGDFGISRLLIQSDTESTPLYCTSHPCGTFPYMDPELITKGELTPRADVYSFGIVILRVLTGLQPSSIAREVEKALGAGRLDSIIDKSAGEWPFVQAQQLAYLGLRCADPNRRNRPDIVGDVWRTIQPMMNVASLSAIPSFRSVSDDNCIPSYFMCPIFQEIMKDPHIAADGFTYEAEAIRGWLENGHDTSPMTNQKLLHFELIPNHSLHSSILEWQQWRRQRRQVLLS